MQSLCLDVIKLVEIEGAVDIAEQAMDIEEAEEEATEE
jgi:hypothetical protein